MNYSKITWRFQYHVWLIGNNGGSGWIAFVWAFTFVFPLVYHHPLAKRFRSFRIATVFITIHYQSPANRFTKTIFGRWKKEAEHPWCHFDICAGGLGTQMTEWESKKWDNWNWTNWIRSRRKNIKLLKHWDDLIRLKLWRFCTALRVIRQNDQSEGAGPNWIWMDGRELITCKLWNYRLGLE